MKHKVNSRKVQKKDLLDTTSILEGSKGEADYVAARHKVDHKRVLKKKKKKKFVRSKGLH